MNHHGSAVPARAKSYLLEMGKKGDARQGNQTERKTGAGAARSAADWCCKLCLGPDGMAYRNFGDRKVCRKCQVAKGTCFLYKADEASSGCPSSNIAERQVRQRQASLEDSNRELRQKLAAKERELAKLAVGGQQGDGHEGRTDVKSQPQQPVSAEPPATTTLRKQIQQLKGLELGLRESLCADKGGYAAVLKDLEARLDAECIKQREQRPTSEQKASAEAHFKRMQKAKEDATCKLEQLQAEQAALASRITLQTTALAEVDAKLQKARMEVAAVTEKASAELRGAANSDSAVTASAVTSWFNKLPPEVAQHAEAQQAMQAVMALMEKLDEAKKVAEGTVALPQQSLLSAAGAGQTDDVEFKDADLHELERQAAVAKRQLEETEIRLDKAKQGRTVSTAREQHAGQADAAEAFDELGEMELDETQVAFLATRMAPPQGDDEEEEQYQERIKVSAAKLRGGSLPLSGRSMLVRKTKGKK